MKFNMIVTNPPYIDPDERSILQKELLYEPDIALFADDHGRSTIERIILESNDFLLDNGIILIEIDPRIVSFIEEIGNREKFSVSIVRDYSGLERVAILKK